MKSYDNSKDALDAIYRQFGADILLGKLNSYFADFAPSVNSNVKKLVYSVYESGASKTLRAGLNGSQEDKERAVKLAVRNLTDCFFEQDMAEIIIFEFTSALGWELTNPAPAPDKKNELVQTAALASAAKEVKPKSAPVIIKPMSPPNNKLVEMIRVSKVYDGGVRAVNNINLIVGSKELVVILGPSGSGKSTLLKMIAGHESITEGELKIDGEKYNTVKPADRNVSYISQDYNNAAKREARMPLIGALQGKARLDKGELAVDMSVYDNMAYELQKKKVPKAEIDKRINEVSRLLDIEKFLDRKIYNLSGGQRCRVAMGRAIIRNSKVSVYDDILANLDPVVRRNMRAEFSDIHLRLNATIIFATSDYTEAMSMATKIVVLKDGQIQQIESPLYIYNYPVNKFVAGFMGNPRMNFLVVNVRGEGGSITLEEGSFKIKSDASHSAYLKNYIGKKIYFGIRADDLDLCEDNTANCITLKITVIEPLGSDINLWLTTDSQSLIARTYVDPSFKVGDTVNFIPNMNKARYFDLDTEQSILPL